MRAAGLSYSSVGRAQAAADAESMEMALSDDPLAPHRFDPSVLREYDLRGTVGTTITERDAYALGRAFGSLARRRGAQALALGYDGRSSSPLLAQALGAGQIGRAHV